jgi:hypothetical protein
MKHEGQGMGGTSQDAQKGEWGSTVLEVSPLAAYDPSTDTIMQLGGGDRGESGPEDRVMTTQENLMEGGSGKNNFFIVHIEDGGQRLIHQSKWPKLTDAVTELTRNATGAVDAKEDVAEKSNMLEDETDQPTKEGLEIAIHVAGGDSKWLGRTACFLLNNKVKRS